MSITYPGPLSALHRYWKYGPTSGQAAHWYVFPATIAGNTITFTITDGGLGDDDLIANGAIVDAGGVAITAALGSVEAVPTLSEWAMLMLVLMMVAAGWRMRWAPRR